MVHVEGMTPVPFEAEKYPRLGKGAVAWRYAKKPGTDVKNGVVVRIGPTYGYGKAEDLYGNRSSHRWDPRICQKGLGLVRRVYGDRRVKGAMVRRGFKQWVDDGFPRGPDGRPNANYFQRGRDRWLRVSWDEAYALTAAAMDNIARTYSSSEGARLLAEQGYDPAMIEAMHGAGTQTLKFRGGMAFLGATRIFGLYRFANMLALLDSRIRNVGPDKALGGRGWDSYSWHTDLPPGHPMVTGMQTNDFDLSAVEHSRLAIAWGMNWITTKMPDAHWLTEARLAGTKTVAVTVEYSATASKTDEVIVIRPGTDPAFALGLAQVILAEKLFDGEWIKRNTDLPFLVRLDTLEFLRPEDVQSVAPVPKLQSIDLATATVAAFQQKKQHVPPGLAADLKSFHVWDRRSQGLKQVTRDDWGPNFQRLAVDPDLDASLQVRLKDGVSVTVRTVFGLTRQYLAENMNPHQVAAITGTPPAAIVSLARQIAANPEKTLFVTGMGPNQFFNADLKDRAIFLVAALTRNVGFPGGNVGSYAGNYRAALFNGVGSYAAEDPFQLRTRPWHSVKSKKYTKYESLHYFNYGDRPLRYGKSLLTGQGHVPTPTKAMWLNNSNSVIGNIKWHYDVVHNTLPKLEMIAYADWWWTGSCEYSDIVFGVDSWAEFKAPDMTASCTNPFVQVFPVSPIKRVFDTRGDLEVIAGVARALGRLAGDGRMEDMWKYEAGDYLQRIIDRSAALKGYDFDAMHAKAKDGIPTLMNNRTYPRISSFEQSRGEVPWYTKSGRLEFYRPEPEFRASGENMIVYREPVDATPYEPNVIVSGAHPAVRPKRPEEYGARRGDLSAEARQARNVIVTPAGLLGTRHPLRQLGLTHVYHTPKYRHGAHSTPVDTDITSVWFGPFGDPYRRDRRQAGLTEGYVDLNPLDARALGLDDGDYVYVDADPEDRPYRNWKRGTTEYHIARLMLRVRFYPGTPRGIARTWHNMYGATFGSVLGHESRPDGLARNPETEYQSMYRYGSHQSATRAWLRPTLMTETLYHKEMFGQGLERGFAADIHCPIGAPRESFVRFSFAEKGGLGGQGVWRPASLGFRPGYESPAMRKYLRGATVSVLGGL